VPASVGVFLSSAMSTNLRSTLSIYAIVCGLLAFVGYTYVETMMEWFSV